MEYKSVNVIVKGKVQGVWFRASTKEKALTFGLKGIVKNLSDGSVYCEVEGTETGIEIMIEWLQKGPILAKVSSVEVNIQEMKYYTDFKII